MKDHLEDALESLLPDSPGIASALARLARNDPSFADADLVCIERDVEIPETKTRSHCYHLAVDGNGRPRVDLLVQALASLVVDYAIPRSVIAEAEHELKTNGSTSKLVRIVAEARSLFTDLERTGEGGELLLFMLGEVILRIPQVICKMSLKTSSRMHYHGADGVHAAVDPESGLLSLYWGEAKLHADVGDAVTACLASLSPYLRDDDGRSASRHRDLMLLRDNVDLNDPAIEAALKRYLDYSSPHFNKLKYSGLALVGFDSNCYPVGGERAVSERISEEVKKAILPWKSHIGRRVMAEKVDSFDIHFFCVPFPSVSAFRARFLQELGLNSDAA